MQQTLVWGDLSGSNFYFLLEYFSWVTQLFVFGAQQVHSVIHTYVPVLYSWACL